MLVKDRMTPNPLTVTLTTPVAEALSFMRQRNVHRLPVLDKKGRLAGIVSEKDLLYASPSPATSLSVYEIGYLLSKLKVEEIMSTDVRTILPQAALEEAAKVMVDNKIGGLPVVDAEGTLVGIITETDVFKATIQMLGAGEAGVRMTLHVRDEPGVLSRVTGAIANIGGDIIALGTLYHTEGVDSTLMLKVRGVEQADLVREMEQINTRVVDVRMMAE